MNRLAAGLAIAVTISVAVVGYNRSPIATTLEMRES